MKTLSQKLSGGILYLLVIGFTLLSVLSEGITVCVRPLVYNCAQTDTNQIQFDVYIKNTGTDTLGYRAHTLRFTMSRAILPAAPVATPIVTYLTGTGDNRLSTIQTTYTQVSNVTMNDNLLQVNLGSSGTTYNENTCPHINPGDSIWLGTFRVTAFVQWNTNLNTNPVWLPGTPTNVSVYSNPPSSPLTKVCYSYISVPSGNNGKLENGTNGGVDPCNIYLVPGFVNSCSNPPTASAGSSQTVCAGGIIYLSGAIGGSATSYTWSAPNGSFSDASSLSTSYTPAIPNGYVILTLKTNDPDGTGPCDAAISKDTIKVSNCANPNGTTICVRPLTYNCMQTDSNQIQFDMYVKNTGIDILGYQSHAMRFTMDRSILPVSPLPTGTVTYVSGSGDSRLAALQATYNSFSSVTITQTKLLVTLSGAAAAYNYLTCPLVYPGDSIWLGTFKVTVSVPWYTNSHTAPAWLPGYPNGIIVFDNPPYSASAKVCVSTISIPAGVYGKLENASNGGADPCSIPLFSLRPAGNVNCINPASAQAGSPQVICSGGTIALSGSIGGTATTSLWSAPSGTFTNASSPHSFYSPSISSGDVTLVLTTNDPDGGGYCSPAVSTVTMVVEDCPIRLNLRALFSAYYNNNNEHTMTPVVNSVDYPGLFDMVTIELHESTSPYLKFYETSSFVDIQGHGNFYFPDLVSGHSYYVVVKHRNSLETWSKVPVQFNSSVIDFDFTTQ